jgi:hypothetical protein
VTPAAGVALALSLDVLLPLIGAIWLGRATYRRRSGRRADTAFWIAIATYLAFLSVWAAIAIVATFRFDGYPTITAVFFGLPLSVIPSAINSVAMEHFFTDSQWLDFGYFVVLPIFLVGLLPWAALVPLSVRRLVQLERDRPRRS